jgi:hypothetical protein
VPCNKIPQQHDGLSRLLPEADKGSGRPLHINNPGEKKRTGELDNDYYTYISFISQNIIYVNTKFYV